MNIISEIEKLKGKHFLMGLIVFLGTIGPGFLIIFHYRPELVASLDFGKLVLFASALTLPFLLLHSMVYVISAGQLDEDVPPESALKFGTLMNTGVLNGALGYAYYKHVPFRWMMVIAVLASLGIGLMSLISAVQTAKLIKRKKAQSAAVEPSN